MKLSTIGHASIYIKDSNNQPLLLTDPWLIGSAYWRSWWLQNYPSQDQFDELKKVKYCYITHEHPDHFHTPSIKKLGNKPKILIPKWFAYFVGLLFECSSFLIKKDLGITRERIYKFTMPTDYRSEKLAKVGYIQKHSVKDRIQNMANWYLRIKK